MEFLHCWEAELLSIAVLITGMGILDVLCFFDLDLDPMNFI